MAGFDVDFVEGFDVFGEEGNGDDEDAPDAVASHFFDGAGERRLKPFLRAHFALEAEDVGIGPGAGLADEVDCGGDVLRIRVALLYQRHGEAVGAEDEMDAGGIWKRGEDGVDALDDGGDVAGMVVKMVDGADGDFRIGFVEAVPFLEAAAGGGEGIVRVEREEDEFVGRRAGGDRGDGFGCVWMPVAHGDVDAGVDFSCDERGLEGGRLLLGETADGRTASYFSVVLSDDFGASGGNVFGEGFAREE